MNRKKKIYPPFLFELLALCVAMLLLYSCEEKGPAPEGKKEILENILKDASQRTGVTYYDLITEVNLNGVIYYEVWSGICYAPFPVYYTSKGEFFCSDHFWEDKELSCNADFQKAEFSEREVLYSEKDNCFDAPPINKYNIEPEVSCKETGAYESSY